MTFALRAQKMKDLHSKPTLQFIKPCLAVILISAKKIKVSLGIFLHEESFAFVSDLGLQTAGHKHRTGQNPPEMGENSLPASDRHINLLEVIKLPWSMWINMEIPKHTHHFLRTKYWNTRYFHDSLPYGTGPGTDTDLASVMNGEGNRRFDEVFSIGSSWKFEKLPFSVHLVRHDRKGPKGPKSGEKKTFDPAWINQQNFRWCK